MLYGNTVRTVLLRSYLPKIVSAVMGIDVHPLAVIISRATYLLAIQDLLDASTGPITLPVFLANALNMPPLQRELLVDEIALEVDGTSYPVPMDFVLHGSDYDAAIEEVIQVGRAYGSLSTVLDQAPPSLKARIAGLSHVYSAELIETLGKMARHIAVLIRERRDSVHGFLLKNHYRPAMLRQSFDYVVETRLGSL